MHKFLDITESELSKQGAIHTAREIAGQPELWDNTWQLIKAQIEKGETYLAPLLEEDNLEIILTGAGTSAFIGEVLCGHLQKTLNKPVRAVATTDIVTHPENYFLSDRTILLVSFARSGNSPESVAAVNLANQVCNNIFHLIITCNRKGEIVRKASAANSYIFLLPPEADDKSLAMTGSFSSMVLAGVLIWPGQDICHLDQQVDLLCQSGQRILDSFLGEIKNLAQVDFRRAVFLGSGPAFGTAHESHLKLQELSDGKVICKFDSFLGFRHGPKAVIDKSTLNVFLFSSNAYVRQYEVDLVKSVNQGERGIFRMGVMEDHIEGLDLDLEIVYGDAVQKLDEPLNSLCSVLPAQMLGFFKSLQLGLEPDAPSVSGTITRVVQGVNVYSYKKSKGLKVPVSG